nr:glycosyl hydrolase [Oscillospiraceae bacterium]
MINVNEVLKKLTLEEKACLLSGHKSWHTNEVSRVGLPSIFLTDGPHGLRKKKADDKTTGLGQTELSTCFPAACTTGSSWNKELLYRMGEAMGQECRHYGVNLILGPAVNIKRNPLCGRNFEYFSEDPLITGTLGTMLTRGIEDMGVGTSVKHFACNNNEANRYFGDSIVDERAYREIYLKAFEPIIKEGKPQTVMCAYNKVNGKYASENPELLNDVLRGEWGFVGLVMSDWGAVNDRVEGLKSGLDLEMPGDIGYNRQVIIDAVNDGSLSIETVDTAVRRVLNMVYNTTVGAGEMPAEFGEHAALAKQISVDSAVLMKNDSNILPLSENEKYLVIGDMFEKMRYQGAGSSLLRPYMLTTPKDAFDLHHVDYDYEQGYSVYSFVDDDVLVERALEKAKKTDTIIFFGGLSEYAESEGFDRKTLSLPENQLDLLRELAKLHKRIVFVMFGGCPVDMSFDSDVGAVLNMYLPGEEGGEAAYELLFGKANPSGRLAETWPNSYADVPFGSEFTKTTNDRYKESIFVGYRYYTTFGVPVKYPFGFGLSYTNFSYKNMRIEKAEGLVRVFVDVTNEGDRDGAAVAELFVKGPDTEVIKPLRELRAFEKVYLKAGDTKEICLKFSLENLKHYIDGRWQLENGEYVAELCLDAETVVLSKAFTVTEGGEVEERDLYIELYGSDKQSFLDMTDSAFDRLIGREIPSPTTTRPYDLNTPIREYNTFGGKAFFGIVNLAFNITYNIEKLGKETPDKETKVKNAYFSWQIIKSMSLRSISYASEGMLSHKMACVLLDIANNNFGKAIVRLFKHEKCVKLPE